jgi:hypothetical protein
MNKLQSLFLSCAIIFAVAGCNKDSQIGISVVPTIEKTQENNTKVSTSTYIPALITETPSLTPDFNPIAETFTKLPPENCPEIDPQLSFTINTNHSEYENDILSFLNAGGTVDSINRTFTKFTSEDTNPETSEAQATDLTGDGVFEVIVLLSKSLVERTKYIIYGCTNGQFQVLFSHTGESELHRLTMPIFEDLNGDGLKEIISEETFSCDSCNYYGLNLYIIGWSGYRFSNMIEDELIGDYPFFPEAGIYAGQVYVANGFYELVDIDQNGTIDIVLTSGWWRGQTCLFLYRDTKMVLMWNGHGFIGYYHRTPAVYRIQAVWDGDEASLTGRYESALLDYSMAISDEKLLAWSPEYLYLLQPGCMDFGITPTPINPILDKNEWPRLAAYSYYRLILLHVIHGNISQAQDAFHQLQSIYLRGDAGFAYAQLAKTFWEEYKNGNNIAKACQSAKSFAQQFADQILAPLGRITYGANRGDYEPEDICPFK